jgi:inner membrane protein
MDNLAHTLAGAALGEAGLKQKTGLGMATLMIAANLPDLDALGLLFGANLDWRRGWTHGPIALLLLPLLLTGAMIAFDRWQASRGKRPEGRLPIHAGWLLALAYIGILSHPLMDFLNTYGIRFLMPFSERWFYGDTLFIVDVWMWSALALGTWLARRRRRQAQAHAGRPALIAILAVVAYTSSMGLAGRAAERFAANAITAEGEGAPRRVLASPVPVNPFRREILADMGDAYRFGELHWTPAPQLRLGKTVPTNMADPLVARAAEEEGVASFLYWSRFPFARIEQGRGEARVTIGDARYSRMAGDRFSATAIVPTR